MPEPLSDIESIRRRPGMYIGDVRDGSGLVHMIWELVANALDEHLAGRCHTVSVTIEADGSVVVDDDGRGIPVDPIDGIPFAQIALTSHHRTPTLDGHAPHEHVGKTGVGIIAVNALSSWLRLDSFHRGRHYVQSYERGLPVTRLADVGPTDRTGTRVAFLPDPTIFPDPWINPGTVVARLRELSWLLPTLTLSFADHREHRFFEPRGLHGLLERSRPSTNVVSTEPLVVKATHESILVEAAMEWRDIQWSSIESFANIERTTDGGSHVQGLLDGLADGLRAAVRSRVRGRGRLREAVQQGLHAVVCVRLDDPTYDQPTKSRLVTPEAVRAVRAVVAPAFEVWLERQPQLLERFESLLA